MYHNLAVGKTVSFKHETAVYCSMEMFGKLINKINFQNEIVYGVELTVGATKRKFLWD